MKFLTSVVLSAMIMTTAFAQRGVVAARVDASKPDPPLSTLNTWAESHLTTVIEATSATALTAAFSAFLSSSVSITVNEAAISSADYMALRFGQGLGTSSVQYTGFHRCANSGEYEYGAGVNHYLKTTFCLDEFRWAGSVAALFFNNDIHGKTITSAMNLIIGSDSSASGPEPRRFGLGIRQL
ncbi:hypothetical protein C8F04DRAFT_1282254 [Mycena alexandri]|uniref:Uncharacterized protein n=1 Tax=Mycena alexandri TaxID=1745969 RepID=A0AAD6RZQ9_9AGAR|nr:hypothetical protein C8F04DRAFT_1282254 [Mycena alexandri]